VTKEQLLSLVPASAPAEGAPAAEPLAAADAAEAPTIKAAADKVAADNTTAGSSVMAEVASVEVGESVIAYEGGGEMQLKAALRFKVETMWEAVEKDADGTVERLRCWDFINADAELPALIANGDAEKGKALLVAMKSARHLDISGDGKIDQGEFYRLLDDFDPTCVVDIMYTFAAMCCHNNSLLPRPTITQPPPQPISRIKNHEPGRHFVT